MIGASRRNLSLAACVVAALAFGQGQAQAAPQARPPAGSATSTQTKPAPSTPSTAPAQGSAAAASTAAMPSPAVFVNLMGPWLNNPPASALQASWEFSGSADRPTITVHLRANGAAVAAMSCLDAHRDASGRWSCQGQADAAAAGSRPRTGATLTREEPQAADAGAEALVPSDSVLGMWRGTSADGAFDEDWIVTGTADRPAVAVVWSRGGRPAGFAHAEDVRALTAGHLAFDLVMDRPADASWRPVDQLTDLYASGGALRFTRYAGRGSATRVVLGPPGR